MVTSLTIVGTIVLAISTAIYSLTQYKTVSIWVLGVGLCVYIFTLCWYLQGQVIKNTKSEQISPTSIDYKLAIKNVTEYRDELTNIWNLMNTGGDLSVLDRPSLRRKYEIFIRPYAEQLQLNEPSEIQKHDVLIEYDNPVDLLLQHFEFYYLSLSVDFLNSLLGRLQSEEMKLNKNNLDK